MFVPASKVSLDITRLLSSVEMQVTAYVWPLIITY